MLCIRPFVGLFALLWGISISKTKRANISSQFMKECKPRMSKSRFQFAVKKKSAGKIVDDLNYEEYVRTRTVCLLILVWGYH